MARVPAKVQFTRHQLIREIWLLRQGAFGYLPMQEQWIIHRFYQPDVDHDATTLAVRQTDVVERDPALPHRAGKAYKALTHIVAALERREKAKHVVAVKQSKGSRRDRVVRVHAIARPQPDVQKLARLLIELAQSEVQRDKDDQSATDEGHRA